MLQSEAMDGFTCCLPTEPDVRALPDCAAVFILRTGDGEPYVSRTKHLRLRIQRLLDPAALTTKRVSLAGRVSTIEFAVVHSEFESRWTHYQALRREFPKIYRNKLRLRGAPLIRLSMKNPFPRAAVTRSCGTLQGETRYYGPYPSRKQADAALHATLDLFQVRRCIEDLEPDPGHPGCIYGEMKMCLAPCQMKTSAQTYLHEVAGLRAFLDSNGESLLNELAAERERFANALDFEQAAALHARWQKVKDACRLLPEFVCSLHRWNAALLLPGSAENRIKLCRMREGFVGGPLELDLSAARASGPKQIAIVVRDVFESIMVPELGSTVRSEHLSLIQRWLYHSSKKRVGELVQTGEGEVISLRRLGSAAERVLTSDRSQPAIAFGPQLTNSSDLHVVQAPPETENT